MFRRLRQFHQYTQRQFPGLRGPIDFALAIEIGYSEGQGHPLTAKTLLLLHLGPSATVCRHLKKLVDLGLIHKRRTSHDKRISHLEIDPALRKRFAKYLQRISHL